MTKKQTSLYWASLFVLTGLTLALLIMFFIKAAGAQADEPNEFTPMNDSPFDPDFKKPKIKIIQKSKKKKDELTFRGISNGGDECPPCLCKCLYPKHSATDTILNPYTR